jgi:hypothetical protein
MLGKVLRSPKSGLYRPAPEVVTANHPNLNPHI